MGAEREMTLDEWCGRLPPQHAVNKELATIRAHIEALEADNERLKAAFDDDDEKASVHWYAEWVEYKRKAEAAESRVRELEGLGERMERLADRWGMIGATHGVRQFTGNDHLLFANELRAAIDSAMQGEEVRG